MPNRRLTADELAKANLLLAMVRRRLDKLAAGDDDLRFAFRRKVYKELIYDERDKPMVRRRLKALKRREQNGICLSCKEPLPDKYCVLDRLSAVIGYTVENTRLICPQCDVRTQKERGYT